MSVHPSLRVKKGSASAFRNVMKRFERVRHMMEKGTWSEETPVYGLPKIKKAKIKAAPRRAAPKEGEDKPGAAGKPAAAAPAAAAKPAK